MEIELDDAMKIATVQQVFNNTFPFLKIEFFEKDMNMPGPLGVRRHIGSGNKRLFEFRPVLYDISPILITPLMTVRELEEKFKHLYKLHTQVFRKSGNVWLETTVTDAWTLFEQNRQGELISSHMDFAKINPAS
ncbi:hypothetical protein [Parasediminibacterium sp. JCM 36343]|uniref:hypothetical protein n=1 Tax=Parasediminibacterium sp. JCM 36343 TaxID=3374279 RepID=UPI003979C48A